jgi:hypothetical protein
MTGGFVNDNTPKVGRYRVPQGKSVYKDGFPQETGMNAACNGKRDLNAFFDGTYYKSNISVYTKAGQDSLFRFTGMVERGKLKLTMHVTDVSRGIEGEKPSNKRNSG